MQNIRAIFFYIMVVLSRETSFLICMYFEYSLLFQDTSKTQLSNSTFISGSNETKAASRTSGLFLFYCPLVKSVRCLKIRLISHSNSIAAFFWI